MNPPLPLVGHQCLRHWMAGPSAVISACEKGKKCRELPSVPTETQLATRLVQHTIASNVCVARFVETRDALYD